MPPLQDLLELQNLMLSESEGEKSGRHLQHTGLGYALANNSGITLDVRHSATWHSAGPRSEEMLEPFQQLQVKGTAFALHSHCRSSLRQCLSLRRCSTGKSTCSTRS